MFGNLADNFWTWKSDFYASQLSIGKGVVNCGLPKTFQQKKLFVFFSHKNSQNSTNKGFLFTLGRMCYTTRVEKITVTVRRKFEKTKINWFSKHVLVITNAILKFCVLHLEYYIIDNVKAPWHEYYKMGAHGTNDNVAIEICSDVDLTSCCKWSLLFWSC